MRKGLGGWIPHRGQIFEKGMDKIGVVVYVGVEGEEDLFRS